MLDLFLQLIETQGSQGLVLLFYLLFMTLFFYFRGWRPLSKMEHKITGSREALEDLRSWGKKHPEFSAVKYSREANAPSDSNLNSRTQRWLRLLWSGYCQNKPPIVDEVVQKEEEYLCSDDERIRSTSSSLIILGLLGTFFGLYQVILPIKSIIQNTRDNATITDSFGSYTGHDRYAGKYRPVVLGNGVCLCNQHCWINWNDFIKQPFFTF